MSGSHVLFERMGKGVPWREHDRKMFNRTFREPRMTAEFRNLVNVPENALLNAVRALSKHYSVLYDSLWMNLYRNGQDSTGWPLDYFQAWVWRPDCDGRTFAARLGALRTERARRHRGPDQHQLSEFCASESRVRSSMRFPVLLAPWI